MKKSIPHKNSSNIQTYQEYFNIFKETQTDNQCEKQDVVSFVQKNNKIQSQVFFILRSTVNLKHETLKQINLATSRMVVSYLQKREIIYKIKFEVFFYLQVSKTFYITAYIRLQISTYRKWHKLNINFQRALPLNEKQGDCRFCKKQSTIKNILGFSNITI